MDRAKPAVVKIVHSGRCYSVSPGPLRLEGPLEKSAAGFLKMTDLQTVGKVLPCRKRAKAGGLQFGGEVHSPLGRTGHSEEARALTTAPSECLHAGTYQTTLLHDILFLLLRLLLLFLLLLPGSPRTGHDEEREVRDGANQMRHI